MSEIFNKSKIVKFSIICVGTDSNSGLEWMNWDDWGISRTESVSAVKKVEDTMKNRIPLVIAAAMIIVAILFAYP